MASESDDDLRRSGERGHPDHRSEQHSEPVPAHDRGYDKPPRRSGRSRLTVAVVAGAVLVAGGGGAYWAASAADDSPAGAASHGAPPPLALGGWTGGTPGAGAAPGVRFKVGGSLPSGPASAPVYQPDGQVTRAQAAHLAAALRVPGPLTATDGAWRAAPGSGSGPTLQVGRDAPDSWSYMRAGGVCGPHGERTPGAPICYGAAAGPDSSGRPVSAAAADRAVAPVLAVLGLGGARTDASVTEGGTRTVTADPVVGGLPTHGWRTTFQVGPDGKLLSGTGRMVPLAKGATYPVVSAQRALDELRQPGNPNAPAQRLCGGGVMHPGGVPGRTDSSGAQAPGAQAPGARSSGARTDAGTTGTPSGPARGSSPCLAATPPVAVHSARFGLSAQYVNGRAELVPSWLFQVASANGLTSSADVSTLDELAQPAVDPKFITSPGAPTGPTPSGPGGGTKAPTAHVTSYAADGRTVTLRFWGGLCAHYSGKVTGQTGDAVRVRIDSVVKDPGKKCPLLAKSESVKVTLAQPLGDRHVYDSTDGHQVRAGRS